MHSGTLGGVWGLSCTDNKARRVSRRMEIDHVGDCVCYFGCGYQKRIQRSGIDSLGWGD